MKWIIGHTGLRGRGGLVVWLAPCEVRVSAGTGVGCEQVTNEKLKTGIAPIDSSRDSARRAKLRAQILSLVRSLKISVISESSFT